MSNIKSINPIYLAKPRIDMKRYKTDGVFAPKNIVLNIGLPIGITIAVLPLSGCLKGNAPIGTPQQPVLPTPLVQQDPAYDLGKSLATQNTDINQCYSVLDATRCLQGYNDQSRSVVQVPLTTTVQQPQQSQLQQSVGSSFYSLKQGINNQQSQSPQPIIQTAKQAATIREACTNALPSTVTFFSGEEIGSSSFITPDGLIITNNHVIKEAKKSAPKQATVYVRLNDGSRYIGEVVNADPKLDVAIATVVPTKQEQVCSIGSPAGKFGTFSNLLDPSKMESKLKLTYVNSGGPLLNIKGAMVGVNKQIWLDEMGGNTGISSSAPADAVIQFINQSPKQ